MGARISSGLICVGLIANVSAMIVRVGSRVTEAIGTTYPVLGMLGKTSKHPRALMFLLIYQYAESSSCSSFSIRRTSSTTLESVLMFLVPAGGSRRHRAADP